MAERIILHCDLNNYFASVESIDHEEYVGIPVAVCGSPEERHGIVLAKNQMAKKAGIKTAMTVLEAKRLCPNLLTVPPHYHRYTEYSKKAQAIYAQYTDRVEPFGIDECWLDVTGSTRLFGNGIEIANALRKDMKEKLGLTISVGVSFCKVFAKLGSDLNSADGITVITTEDLPSKIWVLPVGELFGIGRHTVKKLEEMGIYTIGHLAKASPSSLQQRFGKNGVLWWQCANGKETSPVGIYGEGELPKSIGRSTTCRVDVCSKEQIGQIFVGLIQEIGSELRKYGLLATNVSVCLRETNLSWSGKQQNISVPTRLVKPLLQTAMGLVEQLWQGQPLRSLGVSVHGLVSENEPFQSGLLELSRSPKRGEQLENQLDVLNEKMGKTAVCRASQLLQPLQIKLGSSFGHMRF